MDWIVTLTAAFLSIAVSWGIMQQSQTAFRKEIDELSHEMKALNDRFVTLKHFEAITGPLHDQITEIQRDIKSILMIVRNGSNHSRKN